MAAACGVPVVTAPAIKVKTLTPVGIMAPAVVQTTVSALVIPSTAVPTVPAVRTQVAVKLPMVLPACEALFNMELSTALK